MSEIKGQLLGMLIVLGIFTAIGGTLVTAFQKEAQQITSSLEAPTVSAKAVIAAPSGNIYSVD